MRTVATVIAIDEKRATIQLNRQAACDGCHKREEGKECSVCSLLGGNRSFTAIADNPIGAQLGDRVEVETAGGRVLFYAALVFLLPIVVALIAWGIASLFIEKETTQLLIAFVGFAVSFLGIWIYSERIRKNKHDIVIVSVLNEEKNNGI